MSKLSRSNVGQTFTIITDDEMLEINYKIIDESFAHEFGTHYQYGFEVEEVQQFIPCIDKWVKLSDELYSEMEEAINNIIEKDL